MRLTGKPVYNFFFNTYLGTNKTVIDTLFLKTLTAELKPPRNYKEIINLIIITYLISDWPV